MGKETERKFKVTGDFRAGEREAYRITQGYLCTAPDRTVRIRIRDGKGFITIKGRGNSSGASRFEWEKEIPAAEARELLKLCEDGLIDKTRHLVDFGGHTFEVDEFHGENEGLVVAELELTSEDEHYSRPEWLGEEVTGDERYYNAYLSAHPFSAWE